MCLAPMIDVNPPCMFQVLFDVSGLSDPSESFLLVEDGHSMLLVVGGQRTKDLGSCDTPICSSTTPPVVTGLV